MTTLARLLVDTLASAGVERIWGVTGDSLNAIDGALRENGKIEFMHVRNEEAGAFACGAEAAVTGELSVCAGSCGPGNLHLINGLYDCYRNRVPVLAIASHIPSTEIGLGYFQETHPTKLFEECSEFCELVTSPKQMPGVLHRALRTAIGRNTVSVIVIPGDVSLMKFDGATPVFVPPRPVRRVPGEGDVTAAAELLNGSQNVTILAGAGTAGAHDEVVALANALKAPIVHAFRGKEYMEWDNPFDVGMTGLIGFSSGYHALKDCDTLLMLGSDFPYRNFYPEGAKVIQVDRDPGALGKRVALTMGIEADVVEFARMLTPQINGGRPRDFLDKALKHYANARRDLDALATPTKPGKPLHPQYVYSVVNEVAAEDAVFTVDVGTPAIWTARYLHTNGKRRIVGSFNHGSMANALPQALGAQAAFPDRQVVSMSGDGGLAMLFGELMTAVQLNLPVKIVVLNNGTLGFVELEQKAGGYLPENVALKNPNFADVARSLGLMGVRVEDAGELKGALTEAFAHDGPALIDVVSNRQELAMPPAIKAKEAVGFSLYGMRAILNSRGDEIMELAKSNLFR
ncbi:pyruvate dehydrogenase [Thioclava dalianensis]|uniref:Pyruvate dehydrogenase n=1 Tax=Thioclava dalianensis TaxID=1185766 RepID=A0A074U4E6_9RHOB|nr:ubiquinone-dependent pyruvate dehydrogenase [Thioclava dalianensis]KEP69527.1 pyruvate dehydrogenase [Thioclava dalianensis]SFN67005.1 pyruvate dehydrogenase (quinone) [Thioclava dalianensis]